MRPFIILLGTNSERHKIGSQLADALDFKATILPDNKEQFKVEVKVNLPLEPLEIREQSNNTNSVRFIERELEGEVGNTVHSSPLTGDVR